MNELIYKKVEISDKEQLLALIDTVIKGLERPEFFIPYSDWELDNLFDEDYAPLNGAYDGDKIVGMTQLYVQEEMLKEYMARVEENFIKNRDIEEKNKQLNIELKKCIKKLGIVRYTAFKDTGSDLSFALALLDDSNNGVVLNGIYSREMSNIYAKQVIKGESPNKVSEEERQAIEIAIGQSLEHRIKE